MEDECDIDEVCQTVELNTIEEEKNRPLFVQRMCSGACVCGGSGGGVNFSASE